MIKLRNPIIAPINIHFARRSLCILRRALIHTSLECCAPGNNMCVRRWLSRRDYRVGQLSRQWIAAEGKLVCRALLRKDIATAAEQK